MIPTYDSFIKELSSTRNWKELNKHRQKAISKRIFGWVLGCIILALGLAIFLSGADGETLLGAIFIMMSSAFVILYFYKKSHKHYSRHYKQLVVPQLIADVIQNCTDEKGKKNSSCHYDEDYHIDVNLLYQIPLFQKYNHRDVTYTGEDLFSGTLGETDFQFSDFTFKKRHDQDTVVTIFHGLIFIADFHKTFAGTTTLMTRKGRKYSDQKIVGSSMKTESQQFNQLFKISTTDEITTRYLLPANLMDRIIELRNLFPKKGMAICLHEGKLVISINDVDFFESDGLKKPEAEGLLRIYEEIKTIVEIIDLLNLNLRIWSKQNKDFVVQT